MLAQLTESYQQCLLDHFPPQSILSPFSFQLPFKLEQATES